jgi:O-methyltransferase involved in polyketide biosynthesis
MSSPTKDYSTISPSARSLLWMKALTDIPFVRSAAGLIFGEETLPHDQHELVTAQFLKRLAHFETRYWSIDAALSMLGISNILEIASGFSFRGLHKTLYEDAYYIDTDLPEMIETKETLVRRLMRMLPDAPIGQMLLKPLNALDEDALKALVQRFPPGPIAIVGEGLLVYLDEGEKRKLCQNIREQLLQRGGYWISADIYIRNKEEDLPGLKDSLSPEIERFLQSHGVEEKKFSSYAEAEVFFQSCGFRLAYKATADHELLKSLSLLKKKVSRTESRTPAMVRHHIRETWILEAVPD